MGRDWQLRVKQLLSNIKMGGKFEEQYIFQVPSDGEGERWSDEEIRSCWLGNFSERLWSTLGCPGHLEPEHQLRGGGMSPAGQTVQGDRNRFLQVRQFKETETGVPEQPIQDEFQLWIIFPMTQKLQIALSSGKEGPTGPNSFIYILHHLLPGTLPSVHTCDNTRQWFLPANSSISDIINKLCWG